MKTSTILWLVAGLGIVYATKKAAEATKAKIDKIAADRDKAAGLTRIGDGSARPGDLLDASGNLMRPIGAMLSSRIGARASSTDGLGESFSSASEDDGGLYGGNAPRPAFRTGLDLMVINPYGKQNRLTMMPWWAKRRTTQVNATTPNDPYHLQAINTDGNPVNAELQTSLSDGRPDRVNVATHDGVAEAGSPQPYVEPGDRDYGNMTATDFLSDESNTYNEDPGAMIGLREG